MTIVRKDTKYSLPQGFGAKRLQADDFVQGGFSHGFVTEFGSEEDRRYYLEEDPAHLAFIKSLDGIMERVRVVDYEPGVF